MLAVKSAPSRIVGKLRGVAGRPPEARTEPRDLCFLMCQSRLVTNPLVVTNPLGHESSPNPLLLSGPLLGDRRGALCARAVFDGGCSTQHTRHDAS